MFFVRCFQATPIRRFRFGLTHSLDYQFTITGDQHNRWESVCWGVLGIPLLENETRFKVLGFWHLASWFENISFSNYFCYILPNFHFMFLIDIDLISMVLQNMLRGPSSLFGARLDKWNRIQNNAVLILNLHIEWWLSRNSSWQLFSTTICGLTLSQW